MPAASAVGSVPLLGNHIVANHLPVPMISRCQTFTGRDHLPVPMISRCRSYSVADHIPLPIIFCCVSEGFYLQRRPSLWQQVENKSTGSKDRVVDQPVDSYHDVMNEFDRIKQLIVFLDKHQKQQPSLQELAAVSGISQFHLHRLFSQWAGITPKGFLKCLTVKHAKALLRSGKSVLDTSLDSGLSGPGRLHDLCVSLEAASPGEIKNGGDGWTITAGFADSPFGTCLIAKNDRGICHLSFVVTQSQDEGAYSILSDWPKAKLRWDNQMANQRARQVFIKSQAEENQSPSQQRNLQQENLRAFVAGSEFQVRVWRALLLLPTGSLCSYKDIADSIGTPGASRAVGTAIAKNRIGYLIPCHRVIRQTGIVGDYAWGTERKKAMIAWESVE